LQRRKSRKTVKTQKQTRFLFRETSIFLPKRPENGLFFLSVLGFRAERAMLAFVAEWIALIPDIAPFEPESSFEEKRG